MAITFIDEKGKILQISEKVREELSLRSSPQVSEKSKSINRGETWK